MKKTKEHTNKEDDCEKSSTSIVFDDRFNLRKLLKEGKLGMEDFYEIAQQSIAGLRQDNKIGYKGPAIVLYRNQMAYNQKKKYFEFANNPLGDGFILVINSQYSRIYIKKVILEGGCDGKNKPLYCSNQSLIIKAWGQEMTRILLRLLKSKKKSFKDIAEVKSDKEIMSTPNNARFIEAIEKAKTIDDIDYTDILNTHLTSKTRNESQISKFEVKKNELFQNIPRFIEEINEKLLKMTKRIKKLREVTNNELERKEFKCKKNVQQSKGESKEKAAKSIKKTPNSIAHIKEQNALPKEPIPIKEELSKDPKKTLALQLSVKKEAFIFKNPVEINPYSGEILRMSEKFAFLYPIYPYYKKFPTISNAVLVAIYEMKALGKLSRSEIKSLYGINENSDAERLIRNKNKKCPDKILSLIDKSSQEDKYIKKLKIFLEGLNLFVSVISLQNGKVFLIC